MKSGEGEGEISGRKREATIPLGCMQGGPQDSARKCQCGTSGQMGSQAALKKIAGAEHDAEVAESL